MTTESRVSQPVHVSYHVCRIRERLEWNDPRTRARHRARRRASKTPRRCEDCGLARARLEVHHVIRIAGIHEWQYRDDELEVLCKNCHFKKHHVNAFNPNQMPLF